MRRKGWNNKTGPRNGRLERTHRKGSKVGGNFNRKKEKASNLLFTLRAFV